MTVSLLDSKHDLILITPDIFPDQDEFELWAKIYLHHSAIIWLECHVGADRLQVRFRFKGESFNLNYDYYSDSIWISPEGTDAAQLLVQLKEII